MRRSMPAVLLLLGSAPAAAATLEVCSTCTWTAIQGGLDAAIPGDTVRVHPGTWLEDVQLRSGVSLVSTDGAAYTKLQGVVDAAALSVSASVSGATVEGFTVVPSYNNRGMVVWGEVTLRDLAFQGSTATYSFDDGYGLYVGAGASAVVEDSSFSGLDTSGDGGCIWAGGLLEADGVSFTGCTAKSGGAVYATQAHVDLVGCTFTRSTADGGAVGHGHGGAIFASDTELMIQSSVFEDSTAVNDGGHVYAWWGLELEITDSSFSGGQAVNGGSVYGWWMDQVTLQRNTWTHGRATGGTVVSGVGGHLALDGCSGTRVVGDVFTGGEASDEGGALWAEAGDVSLEGIEVTDSVALYGGGLYWHGVTDARSSLSLLRCHFEGNDAEAGGAVYTRHVRLNDLQPDDLVVEDSLFVGNSALEGGALHLTAPRSLSLVRDTFCWNSSRADGGAVWVAESPVIGQETLEVSNALFVENAAGDYGADLFLSEVDVAVANSTFLASEPDLGGAVFEWTSTLDFRNNLMAHSQNAALYGAGGDVTARYDAFWLNDAHAGGDLAGLPDEGQPSLVFDVDPRLYQQPAGWACEAPRLHPEGATWDLGTPILDDRDGSRSDMGVHGGPLAEPSLWWDDDGDGWAWIYDCDPESAAAAPFLEEHCDGVDEDCDDMVDEDPVDPGLWFLDLDGDGFGDPGVPLEACEAPSGYVADDSDCDDSRDDAHPGAAEVWYDGVDQDCDGASDFDQDRDAFDALDHGGADCDDTDTTVSPDAVDIPDNGRDEDCSGSDSASWVGGGGCACAAGSPSLAWLAWLLVIPVSRQRRKR